MADPNLSAIGRFSSQMLTYLGTQRTVRSVNGESANTYKYASGPNVFPQPGSVSQAFLGGGVVGNYSPNTFNSTRCFFLGRGIGPLYAETMTALTIDMASMTGISTQELLDKALINDKFLPTENSFRAFNVLRDPGNQVGTVTSVNNRNSLQARAIRS